MISAERNKQPVHILMSLAFLTAPYYYIRQYGFDFSRGSSFSLVDFFLFSSVFFVAYKFFRKEVSLHLNKPLRNLLIAGGVFIFLCLFSGITAPMFGANTHVNWRTLFSGASQYTFIMIGFPLLAGFFLSPDNIKTAIRYIAIGYLPPMLINILLAPEWAPAYFRELFFSVNRAIGTYGNANSLAEILLVTLPLYVYLIATESGFWKKIGYIGLIAMLDCLFLSGSFSGMLSFVVVLFANLALLAIWKNHPLRRHVKKAARILGMVALMFACSYVALSFYAPYIVKKVEDRVLPGGGMFVLIHGRTPDELQKLAKRAASATAQAPSVLEQTVDTRMELNYRGLKLIKERMGGLFYGHGLRQTCTLPEFNLGGNGLDVHLLYLLLWIEGGFILAAAFGVYLLLLLKNCVNMAKTHPAEAIALATAILSVALFGLFLPHAYLRYFWVPVLPAFITTRPGEPRAVS